MGRIRRIYALSWVIVRSGAQSTAGSQRERFFMQGCLRRQMTLGQMAPRMSPGRSAASSKMALRHLRLAIASTLRSKFLSVFRIFICFRALAGVFIDLVAI